MFDQFTAATLDVDGSPIHYVRGGSGPALLLLHGHPQTHASSSSPTVQDAAACPPGAGPSHGS